MDAKKLIGRENELTELVASWLRAQKGQPQVHVVVADSGYGKTRLVQALYAHLVEHFDLDKFWPSELSATENSLRVMPAMEDVADSGSMPWLWWGVRWPDPALHNALKVDSLLLSSYSELHMRRHIEALRLKLDLNKSYRSVGLSVGKALLSLIPGAASAAEIVNASLDVLEALKIGRSYRARLERAEDEEKRALQEIARTVAIFAMILEDVGPDNNGLPIVLFLDDAQWMDPFSIRIVDALWAAAKDRNWRLLIIATHWEREWLSESLSVGQNGFASSVMGMAENSPENIRVLELDRLDGESMRRVLSGYLPGLLRNQQEHYIELASGNPRFLFELYLYFVDRPELFEEEDIKQSLAEDSFEENKFPGLAIDDLERLRFNRTREEIKIALGLSSMQGDQFIRDFTTDIASVMKLHEIDAGSLLEAEHPLVLVSSIDESVMEFRSRAIFSRSRQYLAASKRRADLAEYARLETVKSWVGQGKISQLRKDVALYQVHKALVMTADQKTFEDCVPLLDYLVNEVIALEDYRYAVDIRVVFNLIIDGAGIEQSRNSCLALLEIYLKLLDSIADTEYSKFVIEDAPRVKRCAEAVGDPKLFILAARIYANALSANGHSEEVLEYILNLPRTLSEGSRVELDKIDLIKASALYRLGRYEEALEVYDPLVESFKVSDEQWGAFILAALVGRMHSVIRSGSERWDEEYVDHVMNFAKALTTARFLAGSIPYGYGLGMPPEWLQASVKHDMGMYEFTVAITQMGTLEAGEKFRGAIGLLDEALKLWNGSGVRPGLRARTVWVLAAAQCADSQSTSAEDLQDAIDVIAEMRGANHPEVMVAKDVQKSCAVGMIGKELLLRALDHGWQGVTGDLYGPPLRHPRPELRRL